MIIVKYKPNRFENKNVKKRKLKYNRSITVGAYIRKARFKESKNDLSNYDIIVDGRLEEDADKLIYDSSSFEIIFTPKITAPVVAVYHAVVYVLASVGYAASLGTITSVAGAAVVGAGVIAYNVNAAMKARQSIAMPTIPSFDPINLPSMASYSSSGGAGNMGSLEMNSPTYDWNGMQTSQKVGSPVPIVYGTHKVAGNIINQYVSQDGDKAYLNMLIALCEGEIEDISTILINGQPLDNFSGITAYERYGTNTQAVTPYFEELHSVQTKNALISAGSSITYTTVASDIESFEINFKLSNGLYRTNPQTGSIESRSISLTVGYRVTGVGGYTNTTFTTTKKQRSVARIVKRIEGLSADQYDIKITNNNAAADQYTQDICIIASVDEIKDVPVAYVNTATLGIRALAQDQLSGGTPNVTCVVDGMKVSAPRVMNGAVQVNWEGIYWNDTNSEYRLLSGDASLTWDGTTFVDQFCANPVWCLKDLITNNRYGLGDYIGADQIDDSVYLEMSRYCEEKIADGSGDYEKRFRFDIVIDSFTRALDLLVQLSSVFRAYAFYSNGTVLFKIDKIEDATATFTMKNIVANSFAQSWKSIKETPNIVEVTFLDASKNYEQNTIQVKDDTAIETNGDIRVVKKIRVFCTKLSYAIREGRYALNHAKYINRSISFVTEFEGLTCQCVDRIQVSHDVPQWGFSGQVLEKIIIINGVNDKIDWTEDGDTFAATIREGRYTPTNLAAEVQIQMRDAADDNTTVAWAANKITIANATLTTMTLLWASGTNAATTCGDALGYDISADDTAALSYLADNNITEANTTTDVKLDRAVTIQGGSTYKVLVRLAGTDAVEEKTVSTGAGTWTKIQFAGDAFSAAPSAFENYAFGVTNSVSKPYRIMSISKTDDGKASISAIEYNASVIDDTAPTIPTDNYSTLTLSIPDVTDLVLSEGLVKKSDGTIEDVIEIWFNKPIVTDYQFKKYAKARIYYKADGATSYIFAGETTEEYFAINSGLNDITTYNVVVVSVDDNNKENAIADSPADSIYLLGKSAPPLDVTGFVAITDGILLRFSWSANADVDLKGYEIREKNTTWDDSSTVETEIVGTDYVLQIPAFGTKTYYIKAIDTSGNYSLNASSSAVTIDDTPDIEEIDDYDLDNWSDGTIELSSETANVVNIAGDQTIDSSLDNVITFIKGFEENTSVDDRPVIDSLGQQSRDNGGNRIVQAGELDEFLELRNFDDGTYATEGVYISDSQDLGEKLRARINVLYNTEGNNKYQKIEISISDDDVTYSAYTVWGFGEYLCRYFKIKFTLGTNDTSKVARLRYLKARVSLLHYNESFGDQAYGGAAAKTVTLVHDYWKKLAITVQEHGDYYADITKTFNVGGVSTVAFVLKDNTTHALVAGTADVLARGY